MDHLHGTHVHVAYIMVPLLSLCLSHFSHTHTPPPPPITISLPSLSSLSLFPPPLTPSPSASLISPFHQRSSSVYLALVSLVLLKKNLKRSWVALAQRRAAEGLLVEEGSQGSPSTSSVILSFRYVCTNHV